MRNKWAFIVTIVAVIGMSSVISYAAVTGPEEKGIYGLTIENNYEDNVQISALTQDSAAIDSKTVKINQASVELFPEGKKLRLTFNNATAGGYYLVAVLTDDNPPNEDNIAYINQVTSIGESVEFVIFPKSLDKANNYRVLISSSAGENSQALEQIAYFKVADYMLGDADANGRLTTRDALWTLQAAAGRKTLDDNGQLSADADQNRKTSTRDALWILQATAGRKVLEIK